MAGTSVLFFLLAVALYVFSIVCGRKLIKGEVENGVKLSIVNQLLQVLNINAFGIIYSFFAGIQATIGVDFTSDLSFKFGFQLAGFMFSYDPNQTDYIVMINVVPIVIIYLLEKSRGDEENEITEELLDVEEENEY
ncbi:hypothetical protein R9C00_21230 [Flammeovirgaceae bacterium SG7u.111]|nr:hypothetical protein [Flammeovirgaceae bacterium SG7u.132]WPO34226.1 hypothetical protein R9C00_21230 [Flammeovirgaceae bacterium SG7u.111]